MRIVRQSTESREGIALVVVLGFLSILVLMGVALITLTRVERLVAATTLDGTRARIMAWGAIDAAVDDVNRYLWNQKDVHLGKTQPVLVSNGTGGNAGREVNLISGIMTNVIPDIFLTSPSSVFNAYVTWSNDAKWVMVTDPKNSGKVLGRYAYLVLDCTGQLDVNLLGLEKSGSIMQREQGLSIGEIDLTYIPERDTSLNNNELRQHLNDARIDYLRFDSLMEVRNLLANDPSNKVFRTRPIDNISSYSLCYDNGWWDWNTDSWMPALDVNACTEAEAAAAFEAVGFSAVQSADMAKCLLDYRDPGYVPTASDIPTAKAIPMINEIQASQGMTFDPGSLEVRYVHDLLIELWFPWTLTNDRSYRLEVEKPRFNAGNPLRARFGSGPGAYIGDFQEVPPAWSSIPVTKSSWTMNDFLIVTARYEYVYVLTNTPVENNFPIDLRPRRIDSFSMRLIDNNGDAEVDAVNLGDKYLELGNVLMPSPDNLAPILGSAYACNDPRLNHESEAWDTPYSTTMGGMNAVEYFNLSMDGDPEGLPLFVRQGPLESAAELGFLPTGKDPASSVSVFRWNTINLFDERGRHLLARCRCSPFGVDANAVGKAVEPPPLIWTNSAGFINPNTIYSNVLIAAFRGAPIDTYPGGPTNHVTEAMALLITEGIMNHVFDVAKTGIDSLDSSAAWSVTSAFMAGNGLSSAPYSLSNNEKESVIRNSYRLFNANQNLHLVFAVAQILNDAGTFATAEKRVGALVWRDPFPNANGHHEWFIREFVDLNAYD